MIDIHDTIPVKSIARVDTMRPRVTGICCWCGDPTIHPKTRACNICVAQMPVIGLVLSFVIIGLRVES